MKKIISIAFFFVLASLSVKGQQDVDSLVSLLKSEKNDTNKLHLLNAIVERSADDSVWPQYNMQMQKLALKLMKSKNKAVRNRGQYHYGNSLLNLGFLYINKGKLTLALTYFEKGYDIMKLRKDKIGMAAALNNSGYVYKSLGDIPKAIDSYHQSLKLYEELKYEKGIANTLNNIAVLYNKQGNLESAIQFNLRSLSITEKLKDSVSIGISMNNLALLYEKKKGYKIAYDYLNKALELQLKINDQVGVANSYNNIGYLLEVQGKSKEALVYYQKAYDILLTIDDLSVLISTSINIGTLELKFGRANEAMKYAKESYDLARRTKYIDELSDAADLLSKVYQYKKMYKEALEMHLYYVKMRDSALNENTKSATLQMQVKYEYQKKAAADSVKNMEEQRVKDAELRASKSALEKEQTMKYVLYGGLALFVMISIFVYNRYKDSQRKNKIIELQKQMVDEKQKEILDSILYAKRIQDALLPGEKVIDRTLKKMIK